jgi:ribonuclease Y
MRAELKETEKRFAKREDNLEAKLDTLVTKEKNIDMALKKLSSRTEEVAQREAEAVTLLTQRREQLLRVSGLTVEEAKRTVLDEIGNGQREAAIMIEKTVAQPGRPSTASAKSPSPRSALRASTRSARPTVDWQRNEGRHRP